MSRTTAMALTGAGLLLAGLCGAARARKAATRAAAVSGTPTPPAVHLCERDLLTLGLHDHAALLAVLRSPAFSRVTRAEAGSVAGHTAEGAHAAETAAALQAAGEGDHVLVREGALQGLAALLNRDDLSDDVRAGVQRWARTRRAVEPEALLHADLDDLAGA